jgi:flagellar biosynthesis protein FlhB
VVVTNPTHYAVALRYRKEENAAPVVLARGVDHLAALIRAAATRHDVPILENRQLARALHAKARAGRPIPKEFFAPVAQVLAAVYRRRKAAAQSAAQGAVPPRAAVPVVRPAPAGSGGRVAPDPARTGPDAGVARRPPLG